MALLSPSETYPVGDAALGWAFACSRAGSSHLRLGKPCQDAYALWSGAVAGQPCLIAAVADGHGDDRHDQSQVGAALAVWAAIDELYSLQTHYGASTGPSQLVSTFKTDFPRRLGKRWREAVIGDAKLRLLKESEQQPEDSILLSRYGTTLLVALLVGNTLLLGQLGDGSTIFLRQDASIDCPVACETDDGSGVDSLCSPGADRMWRTAACDCSAGGILLLTTDGLVNAFVDDTQLFAFARSLSNRISEFGLAKVASSLPGWLDHYSARGSGDDITLAILMIHPEPERQEPQRSPTNGASADTNNQNQGDADVTGDRTRSACGADEVNLESDRKTG